jgi:DNA-binding response OmpR family regulator
LPDADGCKVAFYVRAKAELSRTPIIMITNDDQQELRAQMEYGVDILLPKITSFAKILVTVDSLLRRVGWEREIITKGDLSLNGTRSEVLRNSRPVATLSSEQFKLFFLLVERSPEFVTEEDISKCVYASDSALEKIDAINMLAYRLRQALGPQLARRIKNKRSRGWIYIPPQYSTQIAPVLSEKVQES